MEQSIPGHVVRLLPQHSQAILRLDNAEELAVCMPTDTFERLHIGDRVWYLAEPGEGPNTKHAGRVVPIGARYGASNYGNRIGRSAG